MICFVGLLVSFASCKSIRIQIISRLVRARVKILAESFLRKRRIGGKKNPKTLVFRRKITAVTGVS